jgi:polyhydroxybutyrate depolymerase
MTLKPVRIPPLVLLVFAFLICLSGLADAGILKDKVREHIVEKLQNKPAPEATASVTDKLTQPGDYTFSIRHDGLQRMYIVHIPPGYDSTKPIAMLVAFHGGGGDMQYMAKDEYYGLTSKADKENFVIVYPNGYSKFQSGIFATWDGGKCCGDARDQKIDDVGFIRAMIANIASQMNIDRDKIYATGMSNGGIMVERLACDMADIFKAVASVAGPDETTACTPVRPISVLNIHARNDDHVLFNGGAGAGSFTDLSKVTDFTSIPDTVAHWVKRNKCRPEPQRTLTVKGAYCDIYAGCAQNTQVKLCVTETGGHSWPGGYKSRGNEPTSKAISANDIMWEFFMAQK